LLGGVSVARLITKRKGKDGEIVNQGSGNPGTMNMLRTRGVGLGLFTLFTDALKGVIPSLFGLLYFTNAVNNIYGYIALFTFGLLAVIGHIFPIYYKFKGGKGIATTFGVFMVADPISTVILFGIMFLVLYFIKIGSLVSLLFILINAVVQLFRSNLEGNWIAKIVMWLMVALDIIAHRQNLVRLIENRENPADLQEGLKKDLEKLKLKKVKKLEKHAEKSEKIAQKYQEKIDKKHSRIKTIEEMKSKEEKDSSNKKPEESDK
jgi:glycerol-3-phosphate acyltransferase PlsY